ncbi:hypothetical protein F5I97DRAFT_1827040 [Phlebopus sp. FC_14]|nr:hypothetical protein F5I97DRAFT_1827040 [Phlebopus sp. FC_14]
MPAHEKDALSVRMWRIEHNLYTTNENLVQRVNTFEDNITVQIHGIKELIGKINATAHFAAVPPSSPALSQGLLNAPTISHYGMRPTFRRCHSLRELIPVKDLSIAQLSDKDFPFDKTKLPDPPTVHLSKDIDRLCREWEQSTLLVVNRRGNPVQYWPEFYKKVKGASGGIGSNSKDEWFSYKHILDALAKEHSANASQDAADAHFFFGNDLGHPDAKGAFSYVKSGKTFLASKDDAIARKWIKLLDDDPEISSRVRNQPAAVTLVATACLHPLFHSHPGITTSLSYAMTFSARRTMAVEGRTHTIPVTSVWGRVAVPGDCKWDCKPPPKGPSIFYMKRLDL